MTKQTATIQCEQCGHDSARIRRVPQTLGKGEDLIVVENVPLVACRNCGESYFTADTLHHLEHIRSTRETSTSPRQIPVANFEALVPAL
ncbi:YgiT-type zinc finger protein [Candidatus Entotheonella palauensis]|uniref:YgiT-type zinc finger protein n=1 Tax=Candidatus Entotheonella palauensis TaxID=93172 RepID=UPI002118BDF6|nr:YgiT-type zinc finger protein [Candidatus Entotheonella palauensis]